MENKKKQDTIKDTISINEKMYHSDPVTGETLKATVSLLKRLPKKYRDRVVLLEPENDLIDGCRYLLNYSKGYVDSEGIEGSTLPVSNISDAEKQVKALWPAKTYKVYYDAPDNSTTYVLCEGGNLYPLKYVLKPLEWRRGFEFFAEKEAKKAIGYMCKNDKKIDKSLFRIIEVNNVRY